jgi:hypothetical protein
MDASILEVEYFSLCIIQAAVGEWVCRRMHQKAPSTHPCGNHSSWWRHHELIYPVALRAARNTRLRSLKLMVKIARLTRPSCPTLAELTEIKKCGGLLRPEDDLAAEFALSQERTNQAAGLGGEVVEQVEEPVRAAHVHSPCPVLWCPLFLLSSGCHWSLCHSLRQDTMY